MKNVFCVGLLVGLLAAPRLFALTLATEGGAGYGPYQTGVGGEFTLSISDPTLISGYASVAKNMVSGNDNFQTFCVEGGEYIYPNATYTANYNDHSVYSDDNLTKGAAWLYSQFASGGNFGGYTSYNYGSGRSTTAALLQNAIWAFMGDQEGQVLTTSNPFEAAAAQVVGGSNDAAGLAAANSAVTLGVNNDNVYVLNMWDSNGKAAQDQLIYTTGAIPNALVPDGGMTVILLGMGLTCLGVVSRRIRR